MERRESTSFKKRLTPKRLRIAGYTLVALLFLANITYMVLQPRPPYWFIVVVVLGVMVALIHYAPCPCIQAEDESEAVNDRHPSIRSTDYGSIDIQGDPEQTRSKENATSC
ncbi:uncharacterized protein [Palaemon carinicauda]|uniref:uncharacterized protein n=1 Tax=Palaemon carinicauda TaxID=392227 RepID=UPI0035B5C524